MCVWFFFQNFVDEIDDDTSLEWHGFVTLHKDEHNVNVPKTHLADGKVEIKKQVNEYSKLLHSVIFIHCI